MSDKTYEATTVEDALAQAAADLGVEAGDLEHEVVEEKRDFWGTGGDTVVIKVRARASEPEPEETAAAAEDQEPAVEPEDTREARPGAAGERGDSQPESEGGEGEAAQAEQTEAATEAEPAKAEREAVRAQPPAEAEPVAEEPGDEAQEDVEPADVAKFLEQIFHDMEFDCAVEIEAEPDGLLATISGEDKEELIEGNGRALSALELLANNAFRHRLSRGRKVRVDAGDFRSRRDEELSDLAFQVAHSAKESGRTQETQPLNPYERRLVHLALAEDSAVTTRSRGSGFLKNVQVIPQKRGGRGRGRGRRN